MSSLKIVLIGFSLCLGSLVGILYLKPKSKQNPWDKVPVRAEPTNHAKLIQGPFSDGPSVTRQCLSCHPSSADEVLATSHWTWLGETVQVPGHPEKVQIGKKNLLNNYCIGIDANWPRCTSCHAGYGWKDDTFDFKNKENVDCLICHDQSGLYQKDPAGAGLPAQGVDLLSVARSVGLPKRNNCGECHFKGGGGDAVKHGDLDGTLYHPAENLDVHMGKYNLNCIDCHRTIHHNITGRSMSVSVEDQNRIYCIDCHDSKTHQQERLNAHSSAIACQTCHIPRMAIEAPTKMSWDWSEAGQNLENQDPHLYSKAKGRFSYAQNVVPEYYWYNGLANRYLLGDQINPNEILLMNEPRGTIKDKEARIWPFKVNSGKQIYDKKNLYLIIPKTYGEGGYWTQFDWNLAARLGAEASKLAYSGEYDFVKTKMFWPLSHMVAPKEKSLQCTDCHQDGGHMNWKALGYDGDPAFRGGRLQLKLSSEKDSSNQ